MGKGNSYGFMNVYLLICNIPYTAHVKNRGFALSCRKPVTVFRKGTSLCCHNVITGKPRILRHVSIDSTACMIEGWEGGTSCKGLLEAELFVMALFYIL